MQVEGMCLRQIVPEPLKSEGRQRISFTPEQRNHLAESYNPIPALGCAGKLVNQSSDQIRKELRVRLTTHHEPAERFSRIQQEETALLDCKVAIDAARMKMFAERLSMKFCGNHDCGITRSESGADESAEFIQEEGVVVVELNTVPARARRIRPTLECR
jgi:hypothetical protein